MERITIIKVSRLLSAVLALSLLSLSGHSRAEYFGLMSGRSADVSTMPDKSIDAGFVTGDFAEIGYQHFGARFNFRVSPISMLYLDGGQSELEEEGDSVDGITFGVGFVYQLEGVMQNNDVALKGSYHSAKLEEDRAEVEGNVLAIEVLFSGGSLGTSQLNWYANIGMHKFDFDLYDETEIGFGGGVVMPISFGEFFAGIDIIDETTFGFGARYFLQ